MIDFKAAIFDLDGTVADSNPRWEKIDEEYLREHGIFPSESDLKRYTALTYEECAEEFIRLGIETMGKLNQLGDLGEVLEQCAVDERFVPVVDFGHLNCREAGNAFPDIDSYRRVFDRIAAARGDEVAKSLHCHFSKIEYTSAGEKRHVTFEQSGGYGPEFEPLAEAIRLEGVSPNIICESAGTQAEDALAMKNIFYRKA